MFAKILATAGLAAGLVIAAAPAASASTTAEPDAGCVTQLVAHVNNYYYTYDLGEGWVTINGIDIAVHGNEIVSDTEWNLFVTEDYAKFVAAGGTAFVACVV